MYMRLAFAVAAHLQPEILLIDEVLAVGDSNFQKRCLGKMEEFRSIGRTVLFVSHNMASVVRLCQRVILMQDGAVVADGPADQVTRRYLQSGTGSPAERVWPDVAGATGGGIARLHAEIGRASCRERVEMLVGAGVRKKKRSKWGEASGR